MQKIKQVCGVLFSTWWISYYLAFGNQNSFGKVTKYIVAVWKRYIKSDDVEDHV